MRTDPRPLADQTARPLGGLTGKLCAKCGNARVWVLDERNSKHGAQSRCQPCQKSRQVGYRATDKLTTRACKRDMIEYKGGACVDCMRNDYPDAVYDFHHRDPATKSFAPSKKRTFTSELRAELNKCDLLCSNCHRTRHATGNLLGESP